MFVTTKGLFHMKATCRSFYVRMEHNEQRKFCERPTVILTRCHCCGLLLGFGKYYCTLQQM